MSPSWLKTPSVTMILVVALDLSQQHFKMIEIEMSTGSPRGSGHPDTFANR